MFSPHNAPQGKSIVEAEIVTNPGDGTHEMSDSEILLDVIGDLERMELAHPSEVCYGRVIRTKYGYVVQDDNYRRNLKKAKEYFEEHRHPAVRPGGRVRIHQYGRVPGAGAQAGGSVEPGNCRDAAVGSDSLSPTVPQRRA